MSREMAPRRGIRNPGRKAMAKALAPKTGVRRRVFTMKGKNVPEWVETDKEFWTLFQAWKHAGGKLDSPECAAMSARWKVLEAQRGAAEWSSMWGTAEVVDGG